MYGLRLASDPPGAQPPSGHCFGIMKLAKSCSRPCPRPWYQFHAATRATSPAAPGLALGQRRYRPQAPKPLSSAREPGQGRGMPWRVGANRTPPPLAAASAKEGGKEVWIQTRAQEVMTTAVESGLSTFLFQAGDDDDLVLAWKELARIRAVVRTAARLADESGALLGAVATIRSADDLKEAQAGAEGLEGRLLVEFEGDSWKVIPAENLIAAFHSTGATLMAVSRSAAEARLMLEALELGVHGIVLKTDSPHEVRTIAKFLRERELEGSRMPLEVAQVTRVEPVGMGDRVCVDTCSLLVPGEGLLVGSFARALFLVHSECAESSYIASRPFRVNAGPVHAYTQGVEGKTAYLSELSSGSQVTIVNALGRCRTAVVGRVKVEVRPLVLVEAETPDGERHSTILQNAETVRLVGPGHSAQGSSDFDLEETGCRGWSVTSVSELRSGQQVYIHRQGAARHTGISIEEKIVEK